MTTEPDDLGGEAACWVNEVCPSCGVVLGDTAHAPGCEHEDATHEGAGRGDDSVA